MADFVVGVSGLAVVVYFGVDLTFSVVVLTDCVLTDDDDDDCGDLTVIDGGGRTDANGTLEKEVEVEKDGEVEDDEVEEGEVKDDEVEEGEVEEDEVEEEKAVEEKAEEEAEEKAVGSAVFDGNRYPERCATSSGVSISPGNSADHADAESGRCSDPLGMDGAGLPELAAISFFNTFCTLSNTRCTAGASSDSRSEAGRCMSASDEWLDSASW